MFDEMLKRRLLPIVVTCGIFYGIFLELRVD